jgi:hypothetical protein
MIYANTSRVCFSKKAMKATNGAGLQPAMDW